MSIVDRLPFQTTDDSCDHESVTYIEGNCTYRDASWSDLGLTLFRYRPYYPRCDDCGETLYDQRYTADGEPTPKGECIDMIEVPIHVFDPDKHARDYDHRQRMREHENEADIS